MTKYAFIKNSFVDNIAVFENPSEELLNEFKEFHNADALILAESSKAVIGGTWDGTDFISLKPYPSWVLDENKDWIAPILYPTDDQIYMWNESMLRWDLVNNP